MKKIFYNITKSRGEKWDKMTRDYYNTPNIKVIPNDKKDKIKAFLLKKQFQKWAVENRLQEKIDECIFNGRSLRFSKKTGKIKVI